MSQDCYTTTKPQFYFNWLSIDMKSFMIFIVFVYFFNQSSNLRFISRLLVLFLGIFTCSLFGILCSCWLTILKRAEDTNFYVGRCMKFIFGPLLNVKVVVLEGESYLSSVRPCVFICNHQSSLDVVCM